MLYIVYIVVYNHDVCNMRQNIIGENSSPLLLDRNNKVDLYSGVTLALMCAIVLLTLGVAKLFINARKEARKRRQLQEKNAM